jgi:hypothetical protein
MTPTPEERAGLLRQAVLDFGQDVQDCSWFDGIEDSVMALIASTIREAEGAAYERAAIVASEESIHPLADQIAGAIRSLKSPKDV